jgi:hypothetical protein
MWCSDSIVLLDMEILLGHLPYVAVQIYPWVLTPGWEWPLSIHVAEKAPGHLTQEWVLARDSTIWR